MAEHLPTDTPDQRAMPAHEFRKGILIAMLDELFQQPGVRQGHRRVEQLVDVTNDGSERCGSHVCNPPRQESSCYGSGVQSENGFAVRGNFSLSGNVSP